ncbi:MAG TPA: hypothetical protein VK934_12280 [Fimbriimonas sp.]|nr:hypothetical protein [Fimbriimonas sp.]
MAEISRSAEEIAKEFGVDLKTARGLASVASSKGLAVGPAIPNVFVLTGQIGRSFADRVRRQPALTVLLFAATLATLITLEYHGSLQWHGKPLTPWLHAQSMWLWPGQCALALIVWPCLSAAMAKPKWVLFGGFAIAALASFAVFVSDRVLYGPYPVGPAFFAAYLAEGLACVTSGIAGLLVSRRMIQIRSNEKLDRLGALTRLQELRERASSGKSPDKVIAWAWYVALVGAPLLGSLYAILRAQQYFGTGAIVIAIAVGLVARSWKETLAASLTGASIVFLLCISAIPRELVSLGPEFIALCVLFGAGAFVAAGGVAGARQKLIEQGDRVAIIQEILRLEEQVLDARARKCCVMVVDASKSSEMKLGADPLVAELAFRKYQAWLDEQVDPFQGSVLSRPGDGAIFSFSESEPAFMAARALLSDLQHFNDERNGLSNPFRLRIGLHTGEVRGNVADVQFTAIIDVAAHVEARAAINGIAVTKPCLDDLSFDCEAVAAGEVDGFSIFLLEPRTASTVS